MALAGLLLFVTSGAFHPLTGQRSSGRSLSIAPDFTRLDLEHRKITLSEFRGKVVLLNFWATWCGPCLTEAPVFSTWQKQYGPEGLQVIGISMDDASPKVVSTVSKLKLVYPVLMGDETLGTDYGGILGLPVTFLIDRKGVIRARFHDANTEAMQTKLRMLLTTH
jgi:cytochrome c biogenesis protein CcmG/thiol:disulfide interchange protein DsbE